MYNRIELPLRPSPLAGLAAAGPWLLLSLILVPVALTTTGWVALLLPLSLTGLVDRWRRCGSLQHPQAVVRLVVQGSQLTATLANQTTAAVHPRPESRISGHGLYLSLETVSEGHLLPAVLLPQAATGNVPPVALRRLRTWLRLMPTAPGPIKAQADPPNALQRLWPRRQNR